MPTWNLGYLKDQAKKRVQGDVLYSDADIVDAINAGIDQLLLSLGGEFADEFDAPSQIGLSEYRLPIELFQIQGVDYNGEPLASKTLNEARDLGYLRDAPDRPSGTPSHYYFRMDATGMYVGLGPCPNVNAATIRIYHARKPVDLVLDAEVPVLPTAFGRAIIHFAVAELLEMDIDTEGSAEVSARLSYHRKRFESYRDEAYQYFGMNIKRKIIRARRKN